MSWFYGTSNPIWYFDETRKKLTSSSDINLLSCRILARVAHISSAVNFPEAAILPNAWQGTTSRNVLLKRGSKANNGSSVLIMCEGQLREKISHAINFIKAEKYERYNLYLLCMVKCYWTVGSLLFFIQALVKQHTMDNYISIVDN